MGVEEREIQRRMEVFHQVCHRAGARLTRQRTEIFREVAASDAHPDAEAILAGVRHRLPAVSLDTVYRTLWWLTRLGLVATLGPAQDRARFDANLARHHHFVCVRCGLTRDFTSEALNMLALPEEVAAIGSIERTQVEVKGVCRACADKEKNSASRPDG